MRISRVAMIVLVVAGLSAMGWAEGEVFEGQDLRNARFTNCDMQMSVFTDCRLLGAQLINITQSPKLILKSSTLDDAVLEYVKLTDMRWNRVTVDGLDAYDIVLDDWEIDQSDLTNLTLERCDLRYITLDHSEIRDLRSEWSSIPGGRWQSTNLSDSDFQGCDFSDSSFYSGSMEDAEFRNVDFSDVRLENCDIRGLVINGVRIDELVD